MSPVISFLGLTVPVGPVSVLLAFLVASDIGGRAIGWLPLSSVSQSHRDGWMDAYGNALFYGLIVGIVGARLAYAAQYPNLYWRDPAMLLSIRPGTLAVWPGLILGCAAALWILHRRGVPLTVSADASVFGLSAGLVVVKLGQFLTGDAFGTSTTAAWGVYLWQATRHPVQLYFSAALLLVFALLIFSRKSAQPGEIFWRFVLLYGLAELFLSAYQANPLIWGPGIRLVQVLSLAGMLIGMFVLSYYAKSRAEQGEPSSIPLKTTEKAM